MKRDALVFRIERRWIRIATIVLVTAAVAFPIGVRAGDRFDDVPSTNVFHDNITWLADAGVTKGCNPPANTNFCPDAPVTRQQMAAFLQRLADSRSVDAGLIDGLFSTDLVTVAEFNKPLPVTVPGNGLWTEVATYAYGSGTFLFGGGALVWARADLFNTSFIDSQVSCRLRPIVGTSGETNLDLAGETDGDQVSVTLIAAAFDPNQDDFVPATATLECNSATTEIEVSNIAIAAVRADFLTVTAEAGTTGSADMAGGDKHP